MKKQVPKKYLSMFLALAFLISLCSIPAYADQKVIWQQTVNGTYDAAVPGVILSYKDELSSGGMDLYAGKMTDSKASADIAYYSGTIAARDIIDLGEVDFDKVDTVPDKGFSMELTAKAGHTYIISTHKGEFAKMKIKSLLASSVMIQYAIFKENAPDSSSSSSTANQGSGSQTGSGSLTYDLSVPGTILAYKNELITGGLDLSTGKMTDSKASADIAINGRTIGARDIIDLGSVDFDSTKTIPENGYGYEVTAAAGHVYIITTHDGQFAKLKIVSLMASSAALKYALLKEDPDPDSDAKRVVYDTSVPGTILVYKNELSQGGMDLSSGSMTGEKSSADIAFNGKTLAARDIIDMGSTLLSKVNSVPDKGYSTELTAAPRHVYIVSDHQGGFYKIKVKYVLASSLIILYSRIGDGSSGGTDESTDNNGGGSDNGGNNGGGSDNGGNNGGGSDNGGSTGSGDLKLDKFDDIALSANIEEGYEVDVTWNPATDGSDESYDIYRSDNGAKFVKLNDLRLGDREYADDQCKVGHYYLYRIIAFDGNDNVLKAYPLMKAVIVKKQITVISLQLDNPKVKVDGKAKTMDSSPVLINKKVMIPASYLAPLFGAKVVWSAKNGTATVTYNKIIAVMTLKSSSALVNNKKIALDAPLQMNKTTLMIPASLLSNVFNMKVKYTSSAKTVDVTMSSSTNANTNNPKTNNTNTNSNANTNNKNTSGLDYAFKTFILWVPGASYTVTDYNSGTNTLYTSAGTLPDSSISISKDGTYIWNSAWDQKIIKGKWTSNGDGTLNLINGQEGKTWKLEQSGTKNEDIFILDGYTWYSGKAVNVKNK